MDNSKIRRIVEGVKTILIVLLSCSALWLAAQTPLAAPMWGLLREEGPQVQPGQSQGEEHGPGGVPMAMAVNLFGAPDGLSLPEGTEGARRGIRYDQAACQELFEQVAGPLLEALSSAGEPEEVSRLEWERALTERLGVYLDFQGQVPLPVLVGWLSGEETGLTASVRLMALSAWEDGLKQEAKRSAIAFLILYLLALGLCAGIPSLRERLISMVVGTIDSMAVTDSAGRLSALALFSNNLRACAFIMLYGLIPFVLLPALSLGMNAMILGVLAAWYIAEGIPIAVYFAALIPHGIFEIPSLIFAFAVGLYVCGQTTAMVKRREGAGSLWDCVSLISRAFLLVQAPLLAAAAFIEAHISPVIASLLTGTPVV